MAPGDVPDGENAHDPHGGVDFIVEVIPATWHEEFANMDRSATLVETTRFR
jgi:hypothetical protein